MLGKLLERSVERCSRAQAIFERGWSDRPHTTVRRSLFCYPIGQLMIQDEKLKLIVFDPNQEAIVKWIL